jgi:hypothetical protein
MIVADKAYLLVFDPLQRASNFCFVRMSSRVPKGERAKGLLMEGL